jgi:hypothetical protein
MRIRRAKLAGAAAAATLILGALAPMAAADGTTQQAIPLDGLVITNDCNGESVTLSGTLHQTVHIVTDSGGGAEVTSHFNTQDVHGVGDQGNYYATQVIGNDSGHFGPGTAQTSTANLSLESGGSAPNFESHILFHITYNANQQPTASVFSINSSCRG